MWQKDKFVFFIYLFNPDAGRSKGSDVAGEEVCAVKDMTNDKDIWKCIIVKSSSLKVKPRKWLEPCWKFFKNMLFDSLVGMLQTNLKQISLRSTLNVASQATWTGQKNRSLKSDGDWTDVTSRQLNIVQECVFKNFITQDIAF